MFRKMIDSLSKPERSQLALWVSAILLALIFVSYAFGGWWKHHQVVFEGEMESHIVGMVEPFAIVNNATSTESLAFFATYTLSKRTNGGSGNFYGDVDALNIEVIGSEADCLMISITSQKYSEKVEGCFEYGTYVVVTPLHNTYFDGEQMNGMRDNTLATQYLISNEEDPKPTPTAETVIEENE